MKPENNMIEVCHIGRIEEETKKEFHIMWVIDEEGCPACGVKTCYELKLPTFPLRLRCPHLKRFEWRYTASHIFHFLYMYDPKEKKSQPVKRTPEIPQNLAEEKKEITLETGQSDLFDFYEMEALQ